MSDPPASEWWKSLSAAERQAELDAVTERYRSAFFEYQRAVGYAKRFVAKATGAPYDRKWDASKHCFVRNPDSVESQLAEIRVWPRWSSNTAPNPPRRRSEGESDWGGTDFGAWGGGSSTQISRRSTARKHGWKRPR